MTPPRFLPLSFFRRPSPRAAMHHVGAPCVHSPSVERIIVAATPPPTASATRHPRPRDRLSSWIPFPRRRERCFASPYGEPWRRARIRATTRHTENCQNSTKRFLSFRFWTRKGDASVLSGHQGCHGVRCSLEARGASESDLCQRIRPGGENDDPTFFLGRMHVPVEMSVGC